MSALSTLVLLTCGAIGTLAGIAGGLWLGTRIIRAPLGSPDFIGVLMFVALLALMFAGFVAYAERYL